VISRLITGVFWNKPVGLARIRKMNVSIGKFDVHRFQALVVSVQPIQRTNARKQWRGYGLPPATVQRRSGRCVREGACSKRFEIGIEIYN
jgi:hypothetical protein